MLKLGCKIKMFDLKEIEKTPGVPRVNHIPLI
jgi:hypothetical protein